MKFFKSLKGQATRFLDDYKTRDPATFAAAQQAVGGLLILDGFIGIDNPFAGGKRSGIFGAVTSILLGGLFMIMPSLIGSFTGMDKMTAETRAEVVAVGAPSTSTDSDGKTSTACGLTVKFSVDGKEYKSGSASGSSANCSKAIGQPVDISYNPANPNLWMNDKAFISGILSFFFFMGLLVFIAGVITFLIRLLSIIFGWKILRSGRALAKSLPAETDLGTVIDAIKRDFSKVVFGFDGENAVVSKIREVAGLSQTARPSEAPTSGEETRPTSVAQTPQTPKESPGEPDAKV